jgi:hypothetical protein
MAKKLWETLGEDTLEAIQKFLIHRYETLRDLRKELDDDIEEEINIANNVDYKMDAKKTWEEKIKIPYIYTIIQTIVARIIQTLFGRQNWLKIYGEEKITQKIEKDFTRFAQAECDKLGIKSRSRDFLEDALVERTNWIHIWPVLPQGGDQFRIDMGVYSWNDVYFDTKAQKVEDTDFFIRKMVKLWRMKKAKNVYFNLEEVEKSDPPENVKENQKYKAQNGEVSYYDPSGDNMTDQVELLEYRGWYNLGTKDKPKYEPVIFVLANQKVLVRVEKVQIETRRKILLFPIRPLRQAKSLIGKSVPQLIKDLQYELNETRSLRMQNFKVLIKLLYKAKKDAGIDMSELFAQGGNVMHFEQNPDDIQRFDTPNLVNESSFMGQEQINTMQQIIGATDFVMGTSAGRGATETAGGIKTITEQALFKFSMMAENMYDDILELIKYIIILKIKYDKKDVLFRYPALEGFIEAQTEKDIEKSHLLDIAIRDLSQRRDIDRAQFINAANILIPQIAATGGNLQEFLRKMLDRLDVDDIDTILNPPPEQQQILGALNESPELNQLVQMILQDPTGQLLKQIQKMITPQVSKSKAAPETRQSKPEEEIDTGIPATRP